MTTLSGPSFISYTDKAERDEKRDQKLAQAMTRMYERPEKELEKRLLEGELAIGHAKKVIRYNVHDDPTRGISGTLVCTNFRLIFITAEKATYDLIELHNRLVNEHDILLNNIDSIYVEYPNKRKKLVPGSKIKDGIHRLELHCKDFRVAAFNFKLTVKGEEKGVIKSLLHHTYPSTVNLLFAFDYVHEIDVENACKIPLYRTQLDWENELRRCAVSKKFWRVTVVNRKFTEFPTMGSCIVVPALMKDNELTTAAEQFSGTRIPCWCWSDSNGCSLVRASTLRPEVEQRYFENKFHEAIVDADPNKRPIKVIDVSEHKCPSCLQLQQSFHKLKSICMPATESEFWETDTHWHGQLHATKWLQYVGTVLETATEAAKCLRERELNVVIKEHDGIDISSAITSLVQLILDPTCRTLEGIQALIQREWVVAGHPFLDRLGHLLQPTKRGKQVTSVSSAGDTTQLAPVFLLFLDCVYQLMVQYPARFEPSVTFLTVLYDATRTTAFDTFMFNNERQRHKSVMAAEHPSFAIKAATETMSRRFLPVWVWKSQFNKSDMTLFNNPLYKMRTMENYRKYVEESSDNSDGKERVITNDVYITDDLQKMDGDNINGDIPDGSSLHSRSPKSPTHGKKKTSVKDKKLEEHRRKIEQDNPLPLNKVKNKSGSLEEKNKSTRRESSESTEENKNPQLRKVPPPAGHFPKVALMPGQKVTWTASPQDSEKDRRPSRSKSDSECKDDDQVGELNEKVNGDDHSERLDDDSMLKPVDPNSPKLKSRFSLRRKKTKENVLEQPESTDDFINVATYNIKFKDLFMQKRVTDTAEHVHPLYPCTAIRKLQFWRQCYFRWLPWSQIYGGGPAAMLQQESILYDEIHILHNKLQMLKRKLYNDSLHLSSGEEDSFNVSGMYFNHTVSQENISLFDSSSSSQNSLNVLSSYFPYSPIKGLRSKSVLGTPITNFLQGGSLFSFGRIRTKHSRSPSNISITHSTDDLLSSTDNTSDMVSPVSKSLEDLTLEPEIVLDTHSTPSSGTKDDHRYRTQSDTPGRVRSKLLDSCVTKPKKLTPPTTPTVPENITYITSL
ncbi:uncharacterized protein LOC120333727 isoform X1 [Styela clava]